jgi:hypothetical protein
MKSSGRAKRKIQARQGVGARTSEFAKMAGLAYCPRRSLLFAPIMDP